MGSPPPDAPRLLLVEDEPQLRDALRILLEKEGYAVSATDSVERAIPLLDSFRPHAILCDGNLPGTVGLSLCAHVRQSPKHRSIRIIAMSADPDQKRLAEILKSQYDVFLQKPFKMQTLLAELDRLLRRA